LRDPRQQLGAVGLGRWRERAERLYEQRQDVEARIAPGVGQRSRRRIRLGR
jgi:hypothetical protein